MAKSRRPVMLFPESYSTHRYNRIHFSFFLQMATVAGVDVRLVPDDDSVFVSDDALVWGCRINDREVIVDYSDHDYRDWAERWPDRPYFKFQRTSNTQAQAIPLGPPMIGGKRRGVQITDLRTYLNIRRHWQFRPGTLIACKQLPNGAAVERRNLVQALLSQNFADVDISANDDQVDFWRRHEHCLAAVCVPGACNNMIDRGHMELLGLGVCTVSPELRTQLPFQRILEPNVHYLQCRDDYSDLVDIVRDLESNPRRAEMVAREARAFWDQTYTPRIYWKWILQSLETYDA
jgi:hypothetical protein